MYEVNYNGRTSYVRNCFCCHIRPGLLCDAETESDLLAIAKFFVFSLWITYACVRRQERLSYIIYCVEKCKSEKDLVRWCQREYVV